MFVRFYATSLESRNSPSIDETNANKQLNTLLGYSKTYKTKLNTKLNTRLKDIPYDLNHGQGSSS